MKKSTILTENDEPLCLTVSDQQGALVSAKAVVGKYIPHDGSLRLDGVGVPVLRSRSQTNRIRRFQFHKAAKEI